MRNRLRDFLGMIDGVCYEIRACRTIDYFNQQLEVHLVIAARHVTTIGTVKRAAGFCGCPMSAIKSRVSQMTFDL